MGPATGGWPPTAGDPAVLLALLAVKGSLVALLGMLAAAAGSRAAASTRHLIWTATLVALLLLPAILLFAPPIRLPLLPSPTTAGGELQSEEGGLAEARSPLPPETSDSADAAAAAPWPDPGSLVAALYAAGALLSALYMTAGWICAWRLTRAAVPATRLTEWRSLLEPRRGRRRRALSPTLLISDSLPAPVTWGWRRPAVLLPADAESWTDRDLRDALLHELAHVERRDWAAALLARLACCLYWFHPLIWRIAGRQALEAERACDDRVLAAGSDSGDYARQLLSLARRQGAAAGRHLATVPMAHRGQLRRRILSILDPRRQRAPLGRAGRFLLLLLLLCPPLLVGPARLVAAVDTAERSRPERAPRESPLEARRLGDGSALMLAADRGRTERVRALLDAGADVNLAMPGDGSALIRAAACGHVEVLQLLIERGADVDAAVPGDGSPLIAAARAGHLEAVRRLFESGADLDLVVPGDENALIQAAGAGRLEVVRYLVERGADIDTAVLAKGREIRTALGQARRGGHRQVVALLRAAGAGQSSRRHNP